MKMAGNGPNESPENFLRVKENLQSLKEMKNENEKKWKLINFFEQMGFEQMGFEQMTFEQMACPKRRAIRYKIAERR